MGKRLIDNPPGKGLRWALRLPVPLYHAGLGWLLGHRFLMLTHTGRKSGRKYETVIEVVKHDRQTGTHYAVSGWGERADWFRNIQADPNVVIHVGGGRHPALAVRVPPERALEIFKGYAREHPVAFKEIGRLFFGPSVSLEEGAIEQLAAQMPMVAFEPKIPEPSHA